MTSLTETLPILDEAVPALPTKLEDVARESDAFHQAAREAVMTLHSRREEAEALVAQVRQALEALRDQAHDDEKQVADATKALQDTAEEQLEKVDQAEGQITTEGEEARTALAALETQLEGGTQRARTAHEEARAALDAQAEEARNRQTDLDAAVDTMDQAVRAAQHAVTEGQALVDQGVTAVKDAMERLLGQAQARLARTHQYLDDLRDEQETAVGEALSQLDGDRERISQDVAHALHTGVHDALDPELDTVVDTLGEVGQHVVQLTADTESRREELAQQIGEVEGRIGPLQEGTHEVKLAADKLGIEWS